MDQAFQYDEDNVGLCALADYPFAWHRHWFYGCRRYMPYCEPLTNTKVDQFVDVEKKEAELKAAVATQPVSVAVNAGNVSRVSCDCGISALFVFKMRILTIPQPPPRVHFLPSDQLAILFRRSL